MKERVTFVHAQGVDVDPGLLKVDANQLDGPSVRAARENRLTVEVAELPSELAGLLQAYRDISVRWASPLTYDTVEPFTSRLSPGLHVFSTPASENAGHEQLRLCTSLQAFGSIDCMSAESFTTHGQGQSVSPPASTFYQELEDLSAFISWATKEICSKEDSVCQSRAEALSNAVSLDILWDSTLQSLRISSLFPLAEQSISVTGSSTRRTEVGIFSKDTPPNQKPHEVGVSGFLTVLGENKKPSGTLFGFPSRHRVADTYFSSDFVSPTGLHPTLRLTLSSNIPPPTEDECGLHAYFTLPRTIFADRYQFADQLFLASKNLTASWYTSLPVDLEAPVYTTKTWGSSVLLQLAPPNPNEPESWTAEVPLHLRYLEPSVSGKVDIEIPYPAVFWACESGAHVDLSNNPFDRTRLGYDGLFSENTVFWHATPRPATGDRIMTPISVPVLKQDGASLVGLGTAAAVALGFAWVLWKLAAVFAVSGYGSLSSETQVESKKRK
ncbi:protease B nonderepressible form [Metarhizium acridum]|uniref:protease B nonderepressible form n=1 Tax=Metarhizium acridum TaxID=92637 RepID=UPI001C6D122A|nr:protease B nonderepressible form [Metarhizium acridum]